MKPAYIYIICTILLIILISLAINLISNQKIKNIEQTTAEFIIDGDTFRTANGEIIRLLCVDTPELGTAGSEDAKAYLSSLILGKDILIERSEGLDKYNRTLAWVSWQGVLVNKEIIDKGFGKVFEYNKMDCERVK